MNREEAGRYMHITAEEYVDSHDSVWVGQVTCGPRAAYEDPGHLALSRRCQGSNKSGPNCHQHEHPAPEHKAKRKGIV